MEKAEEELYRKAVAVAAEAHREFREAMAREDACRPEDLETVRRVWTYPACHKLDAQLALICRVFGVSDERAHKDVACILEGGNER